MADLRAAGCVYAEDEADLVIAAFGGSPSAEALSDYVERRRAGTPTEYILGWAEVAGTRVRVGPGVFIPRPWSSLLVERAAALLSAAPPGIAVELGTGSGALALAAESRAPGARLWATEVDRRAATWAEQNLRSTAGVRLCIGDLFAPLPADLKDRVDVVFGSLPYVPEGDLDGLPRDHLDQEPVAAFDGGDGGLALVARALAESPLWLRPGGHVLLEIGLGQGTAATTVALRAGLQGAVIHRDPEGGDLFLEAMRPPRPGGP